MGKLNGGRHQYIRLMGGITKHQALVTGTLLFRARAVNALGDFGRLFTKHIDNRTGGAIKAQFWAVVADTQDGITHDFFKINIGGGRDFTCQHHAACFGQGFARHTRMDVLLKDGVKDSIRDLVSEFVWVTFTDGFRGK